MLYFDDLVSSSSLPEFMDFKLFWKTILVVNSKFGLFLAGHWPMMNLTGLPASAHDWQPDVLCSALIRRSTLRRIRRIEEGLGPRLLGPGGGAEAALRGGHLGSAGPTRKPVTQPEPAASGSAGAAFFIIIIIIIICVFFFLWGGGGGGDGADV